MSKKVKSGKEVLDDFFNDIEKIENVDKSISKIMAELYSQGKFTDANVKNALQKLRDSDGNKN